MSEIKKNSEKSATGWLIAAAIFALLGGLFGLLFGLQVYRSKEVLPDGSSQYKYKESHREIGLFLAVLACVSLVVWRMAL